MDQFQSVHGFNNCCTCSSHINNSSRCNFSSHINNSSSCNFVSRSTNACTLLCGRVLNKSTCIQQGNIHQSLMAMQQIQSSLGNTSIVFYLKCNTHIFVYIYLYTHLSFPWLTCLTTHQSVIIHVSSTNLCLYIV